MHLKWTKRCERQEQVMNMLGRYDNIFEGIGMIHDRKNETEIPGKFYMKLEAVPVAQKPRQVPY